MPLEGESSPGAPAEWAEPEWVEPTWVRQQVATWERTGGREGTTLKDTGLPVVILVNRGARSGKMHRAPLMRVEEGGRYLAVGSKGGASQNPAWVNNIRTHPRGGDLGRHRARRLRGP